MDDVEQMMIVLCEDFDKHVKPTRSIVAFNNFWNSPQFFNHLIKLRRVF